MLLNLYTGSGALSLSAQVAALFSAGEQGIWLDPSDFSTMFQDSAGTTPVTAVEQPVGLILDKSGRGNHASQATATSRPVLKIDGNGKYYLKFDGVDDSLATASINFTATDKMTMWAGQYKITADTGTAILLELSATVASNTGSFYIASPESPYRYLSMCRGSAPASYNVSATHSTGNAPDLAVITVTHDIAGDLSVIYRNAVAGTNGTADKGTGNFGNYAMYIGSRNGLSYRFNGNLYSLIVRGAASTATQITSGEQYVASKTGVVL